MDGHGGHHLLQEAMKQFRQALATSCVGVKKLQGQAAIEQEKRDTQQKMASLQQEIQSLRTLHHQTERLLEDKTREATEHATLLEDCLSNLQ